VRLLQPAGRASTSKAPRLWVRTCGAARPPCAQRSSLPRGFGLPSCLAWRPHPPVGRPPPPFPAWLVRAAVFGVQGSSCLVSTPAGLALLYAPGLPPAASAGSLGRAPPCFRPSTGHRGEGRNPWQLHYARTSAPRGDPMSTAGSCALATALLVARPLGCSDRAEAQPASGFSLRASRPQVTPRTAGYDYGATWGIAPAGLPPASTAVRLAAPPPLGGQR
jgi:hypothetical protein